MFSSFKSFLLKSLAKTRKDPHYSKSNIKSSNGIKKKKHQ